jgi:membrane associated rhomboid family serine protease
VIPLSDDNPSSIRPIVTIALIVACVLAFLWQLSAGAGGQRIIYSLGVIPAVLLGRQELPPELSLLPAWATVFTSMFMHGGWMHLIGNMLYLWIFGDNVEDRLGHGRYLLAYLAFGAAAALGQMTVSAGSTIPMIGASGAIAGVMGAYFVMYPHSRVLTVVFLVFFLDIIEIPAIFFLGIWFVMELFSGVGSLGASTMTGVAFWAHIAGFATGALTGLYWRMREASRQGYWTEV